MKNLLFISFLLLNINSLYSQYRTYNLTDLKNNLIKLEENSEVKLNQYNYYIKVKKGRTKINVRNTYDISKSLVIAQINEGEEYDVTKEAILEDNIFLINKSFWENEYWLNGRYKRNPRIKFIKGMKLNNIYLFSNGDYLADLIYNKDKETYSLRIPLSYVEKKSNSKWFYIALLEGWVLSDFCDILF